MERAGTGGGHGGCRRGGGFVGRVGRLRRLRSMALCENLGRHIAYDFSEAFMEDLFCM